MALKASKLVLFLFCTFKAVSLCPSSGILHCLITWLSYRPSFELLDLFCFIMNMQLCWTCFGLIPFCEHLHFHGTVHLYPWLKTSFQPQAVKMCTDLYVPFLLTTEETRALHPSIILFNYRLTGIHVKHKQKKIDVLQEFIISSLNLCKWLCGI